MVPQMRRVIIKRRRIEVKNGEMMDWKTLLKSLIINMAVFLIKVWLKTKRILQFLFQKIDNYL
jgi:hypothetical protein